MRTASASRGGRDESLGPSRARPGAHAGRPRRPWLVPAVTVVAILLAVGTWQVLRVLVPDGTRASVSSTADGSAPPEVGDTIVVTIGDDGSMHLVQTVVLAEPRAGFHLAVPVRHGAGAPFHPTIGSVVVREPAAGPRVPPISSGQVALLRLSEPTTRLVLEYDARGVVDRSGDTSNPERALGLVTPLVVRESEALPTHVEVQSVKALNVGCLRGSELTGCGTQTSDGWTVETSGGERSPHIDVLAQLNLAVP